MFWVRVFLDRPRVHPGPVRTPFNLGFHRGFAVRSSLDLAASTAIA